MPLDGKLEEGDIEHVSKIIQYIASDYEPWMVAWLSARMTILCLGLRSCLTIKESYFAVRIWKSDKVVGEIDSSPVGNEKIQIPIYSNIHFKLKINSPFSKDNVSNC